MRNLPDRLPLFLATAILSIALVPATAAADEEEIPLPEDERRKITLSLLDDYPDLAGSPGIKYAQVPVDRGDRVGIRVFFHPHSESHGMKEAYRASCASEGMSREWECYDVVVRRYLSLPSQSWEVRVNGDLPAGAVLALIESSRRELEAQQPEASERPDAAIMISPREEQFVVAWGTDDGYGLVDLVLRLADGGDAMNPDDWRASIL